MIIAPPVRFVPLNSATCAHLFQRRMSPPVPSSCFPMVLRKFSGCVHPDHKLRGFSGFSIRQQDDPFNGGTSKTVLTTQQHKLNDMTAGEAGRHRQRTRAHAEQPNRDSSGATSENSTLGVEDRSDV